MIVNLFYIAVICVCVIDISGFVNSLKSFITRILTNGKLSSSNFTLKPFDCSLCMTFWSGLIYLFVVNNVSILNMMILLLISISTPLIQDVIRTMIDLMTKGVIKINNK
jgi:hypothetical protein